jgi:hypothetical protein
MASITMSANSSDVDVVAGPGAGGSVGSALAVPIANAESPIAAPAAADNSHRIATVFIALLTCARSFRSPRARLFVFRWCTAGFPVKLAPDCIRRMLNPTNVLICQVAHECRRDSNPC